MGGVYSRPFNTFNALGQGDPLTLMVALLLVSVQFRLLDAECPELTKSAVVDDRTVRAARETMVKAIKIIQTFDLCAGHLTNTDKLIPMATTTAGRE